MEYLSDYTKRFGQLRVWIPSVFFMERLLRDPDSRQTHRSIRRWMQRRRVDVNSLDRIILPVNVYSCHWVCMCIDLRSCTIVVYDSAVHSSDQYTVERMALWRWITTEIGHTTATTQAQWATWTAHPFKRDIIPQQRNSCDCGMFTYCFCRALALDVSLTSVSQSTMNMERQHLQNRLRDYVEHFLEETK